MTEARARYVAHMPRPTGEVRDVHSRTRLGGVRVPLITPKAEGDVIEGRFRVPDRLIPKGIAKFMAVQTTQQRKDYIAGQIKRWVEWREHKGWKLNSRPVVKGPFDPPTEHAQAEQPDWKEYRVWARFVPTAILSASLEDMLEINQRAARYGVDLWQEKPTATPLPKGKAEIRDSRPWHDPLEDAEQRRRELGLERKDLLIGPLSEPWPEPKDFKP